MFKTAPIIEKWYKILNFPTSYDQEFYKALNEIEIPEDYTLDNYDLEKVACVENLLFALYMCENTAKKYAELGISDNILLATLKDVVIWTNENVRKSGVLCMDQLAWLQRHFRLQLFRIGRLQFSKGQCVHNVPEYDYFDTDFGLEIHIPEDGKLDEKECKESIEQGKAFFAKYFPEYNYKYLTCNSWLLDSSIRKYLNPSSNILKFADLFTVIHETESFSLLNYLFYFGVTQEELANVQPKSSFSESIKNAVLSGEKFHLSLGIIKK